MNIAELVSRDKSQPIPSGYASIEMIQYAMMEIGVCYPLSFLKQVLNQLLARNEIKSITRGLGIGVSAKNGASIRNGSEVLYQIDIQVLRAESKDHWSLDANQNYRDFIKMNLEGDKPSKIKDKFLLVELIALGKYVEHEAVDWDRGRKYKKENRVIMIWEHIENKIKKTGGCMDSVALI